MVPATNLDASSAVSPQAGVDCSDRLRGTCALALADVVAAKQKLARQVAFFDVVIVCDDDSAMLAAAHAHQRKVFENLAAERAGTNQKHVQSL